MNWTGSTCPRVENCCSDSRATACISTSPKANAPFRHSSWSTYNAYESFQQNGRDTYREVLIRVTKLKNKKYLLEYFGKDKDREYNSNERYTIKQID